jgi:hypothetical protein
MIVCLFVSLTFRLDGLNDMDENYLVYQEETIYHVEVGQAESMLAAHFIEINTSILIAENFGLAQVVGFSVPTQSKRWLQRKDSQFQRRWHRTHPPPQIGHGG